MKLGCGCSVGELACLLACLLGCGGRLVSLARGCGCVFSWWRCLLCGCVLFPCVVLVGLCFFLCVIGCLWGLWVLGTDTGGVAFLCCVLYACIVRSIG